MCMRLCMSIYVCLYIHEHMYVYMYVCTHTIFDSLFFLTFSSEFWRNIQFFSNCWIFVPNGNIWELRIFYLYVSQRKRIVKKFWILPKKATHLYYLLNGIVLFFFCATCSNPKTVSAIKIFEYVWLDTHNI